MGGCRRTAAACFAALVAASGVAAQRPQGAAAGPQGAAARPQGAAAAAIAQAEAEGARTGVAVVEFDGTSRCAWRVDEQFVPASNMKILTAAAVLRGLGREHEFSTRFSLEQGRLVVTAGGDPNWITGTPHGPEKAWRGLVAALLRKNVVAIRGIVFESGSFTGPGRPPTWPQDQLDFYYCAPTGGFVLDQGTLKVNIRPGSGGVADAALVAPFVDVPIDGTIDLVAAKKGVYYGIQDLGARIKLSGKLSRSSTAIDAQVAVKDPQPWFEEALRQALLQGGVRIDPAAKAVDDAQLYEHRTPLQPALVRMLEDSSNFDAEQLARVLGAARGDGSLAGGAAAVRAVLDEAFGGASKDLSLVDASGLSRGNEVTPRLLVQALRSVVATDGGEAFVASLPVAGESGTLEHRFVDSPVRGRVRAKTGWIRGASALSGILERRDGSRCAFAILMNYDPKKDGLNRSLKALQERIVEAFDRTARDG